MESPDALNPVAAPASAPRAAGTEFSTVARAWRALMRVQTGATVLAVLAGIVLIADDLSYRGDKFDGLQAVVGTVWASIALICGLGLWYLLRIFPRRPALSAGLSAVVPGLLAVTTFAAALDSATVRQSGEGRGRSTVYHLRYWWPESVRRGALSASGQGQSHGFRPDHQAYLHDEAADADTNPPSNPFGPRVQRF